MQALAALPHQRLAPGQREIAVGVEANLQLKDPLQWLVREIGRSLPQLLNHKSTEAAMAALEIDEAPIRLHLQRLLQGAQPGL
jgi:hypothetical protein